MRVPRSISHSLLGLPDAAGHLSALLSSSSICCPSVLQHACSSSGSGRGWVLLPPDLSSSVPQGSYSFQAGAPCVSAQSITTESAPAQAQDEARLNTSAATIAAGPTVGALDACWSSITRSHNSRRPAMLLSRTAVVGPARPAAAVLARHVHSSTGPLQAIAAGSSELDAAAGSLNMPADSNGGVAEEGNSTVVQADAAAGMQPGTPLQQQQPSLQPQPSSEAAADPARELTRRVKRSQTPQELLQHLQQYKQEQLGGELNAIHVAASYHRLGDMCRADAAVAGTAAAALLLQHLDQLLPSVQQQLGPRELSNIVRACACAQHADAVPQLLSAFVQPATMSIANSWDIDNVLWALATFEEQVPQQHLEQLLSALASKADTSCQHISSSLWALTKLCQQVHQQQEEEQQQQQVGQQHMEQLVAILLSKADTATPQHISTSLWALGKLGHQVPQQQLGVLLAALTAAGVLEQAMPLAIGNVLLGMAYMGQQLPDAQLQLLLAQLSAKAHMANPQELSNSLKAVAKLGQQVPQQHLEHLMTALVSKADTAVPQDIGSTLWALGKLGQPVPRQLLTRLLAAFTVESMLSRADTQAIARGLAGVAHMPMGHQLPVAKLRLLLAELAAKSHMAEPQHLSSSLWAVAKLGKQVPQQQLELLLTALVSKADTAVPRDIAGTVWALGKLGQPVPQHQLRMLLAAITAESMLARADTQAIANVLQGMAHMGRPLSDAQLGLLLAALAAKSQLAKPQELANSLWAVAKLGQTIPQQQLEQLLAGLVSKEGTAIAQDISISLWAVAKLGQTILQQQLEQLLTVLDSKAGTATPQDISISLWAVAQLGQTVPRQQLEQLVAAFVSKVSTANTHNIANTLWAVSSMGQQLTAEQLEPMLAAFVEQLDAAAPQEVLSTLSACKSFRYVPVPLLVALNREEHMQLFISSRSPT